MIGEKMGATANINPAKIEIVPMAPTTIILFQGIKFFSLISIRYSMPLAQNSDNSKSGRFSPTNFSLKV